MYNNNSTIRATIQLAVVTLVVIGRTFDVDDGRSFMHENFLGTVVIQHCIKLPDINEGSGSLVDSDTSESTGRRRCGACDP